jgi:hypothetical protein
MHGGVSASGGKREGEEWSSGCVVEDVIMHRSAWSDEEEGLGSNDGEEAMR